MQQVLSHCLHILGPFLLSNAANKYFILMQNQNSQVELLRNELWLQNPKLWSLHQCRMRCLQFDWASSWSFLNDDMDSFAPQSARKHMNDLKIRQSWWDKISMWEERGYSFISGLLKMMSSQSMFVIEPSTWTIFQLTCFATDTACLI